MRAKEVAQPLKVLSLSQDESVPAKGHWGSVILKSHLLEERWNKGVTVRPEGCANKLCPCKSLLKNIYLKEGETKRNNKNAFVKGFCSFITLI